MARNRGWWSLELEGNNDHELSDVDREHIAEKIKEGYTSGEVVKDEEDVMTIRDVARDLNLFGINEDWREKSMAEFLEFNGYDVVDDDFEDCEYSDVKGYLGVEIIKK